MERAFWILKVLSLLSICAISSDLQVLDYSAVTDPLRLPFTNAPGRGKVILPTNPNHLLLKTNKNANLPVTQSKLIFSKEKGKP